MEFSIAELQPKKLVGKSLSMSFTDDKTGMLWGSFAPQIKNVANRVGDEKISLQSYTDDFMIDPTIPFVKWAAIEVSDFKNVIQGIEKLEITGGLYAVFHYKGNVLGAPKFFSKIFKESIPNSNYQLDNSRPHFELLPAGKYDPMDENSEEKIYVPIKLK
ncbi:AraC family transcriptional regulator [Flavobacterium amnicola]|uniref:AraC family transcriptional regulator n=1 Tax=Flavobacterium amnicola TaxID=2506422 RepID=A0A4V1N1R1_9FLAO|nr:GyrI-like domain-containing protein [Flavobacterium amnicola]RXR17330.1 AraC family transcriptional regulator [Flavobacterium amnicola]